MKKIIIGVLAIAAVTFAACNNANKSHEGHDSTAMNDSSAQQHAATDDRPVAEVTPQFTNVDPKIAASLKAVVDHYLHIKNGLTGDNDAEAANGGKAMDEALANVDQSLLTPDQKKIFADNADDLKEHAEHISKNKGNIEHQREHFAQMSEDVYALVKTFGAGRALYHDHCPMYNENKGALWLSEVREVKNPYFGSEMPTCGTVEEVIK